jgi:hypothetical protein
MFPKVMFLCNLTFRLLLLLWLLEADTTAYSQVCALCHTWAVKTTVYAGMHTIPTRDQLLLNPNEIGELVSIVITCLACINRLMHTQCPFMLNDAVPFSSVMLYHYSFDWTHVAIEIGWNSNLVSSSWGPLIYVVIVVADQSAEKNMRGYINDSLPVIEYTDRL